MDLLENDLDFLEAASAGIGRSPIYEMAMGNLRKLAASGDAEAKDSLDIAELAQELESVYPDERQAMFNVAVVTLQMLLPQLYSMLARDSSFRDQMAQALHVICFDAFCRGWRAKEKEGKDDA